MCSRGRGMKPSWMHCCWHLVCHCRSLEWNYCTHIIVLTAYSLEQNNRWWDLRLSFPFNTVLCRWALKCSSRLSCESGGRESGGRERGRERREKRREEKRREEKRREKREKEREREREWVGWRMCGKFVYGHRRVACTVNACITYSMLVGRQCVFCVKKNTLNDFCTDPRYAAGLCAVVNILQLGFFYMYFLVCSCVLPLVQP